MPEVSLPVARASFLRLMIPQLAAGGFSRLAAEYCVELGRLEGRSPEDVAAEFGECAREGHQHGSSGDLCLYCQVQM